MSHWTRACALSQVADESAVSLTIGAEQICLARSEGTVYALRDVCSHGEVALSDGEVEVGTVECWLHGSRFDLATGKPTGLPANRPVPTYPVKVEGDDVLVSMAGAGSPDF